MIMAYEDINDAVAYGVRIEPVTVSAGQPCWKVIKVHHVTPEENNRLHHIFIDALDEKGERLYGTKLRVTWQSGEGEAVIDKPLSEPGTNIPMWKKQVCAVEVMDLPSDRVVNLHTAHPDEGEGNTLYHHSFEIIFKKTVQGGDGNQSVIKGTVVGGAGMTLLLLFDSQTIASQILGPDESFNFTDLAAGTFSLRVEGTGVAKSGLTTDGHNVVTVNLYVGVDGGEEKVLAHYLLFGQPGAPGTRTNFIIAQDYVLNFRPSCGFSLDEARKARRVTIVGGTEAISEADEEQLRQAGCQVERLSGDSYAIEQAFATLSC
jgi:hypothetical protein